MASEVYQIPVCLLTAEIKHCVYKHLNDSGTAIYVGMTTKIVKRTRAHATSSVWWAHVKEIQIETYDTRAEAAERETNLIDQLQPKYNRMKVDSAERNREAILDSHKKLVERAIACLGGNQKSLSDAVGPSLSTGLVSKWCRGATTVTVEYAISIHIATSGVVQLSEFFPRISELYELKPEQQESATINKGLFEARLGFRAA